MNITRLAIENNRLTIVLLLVIAVAGTLTFLGMPRAYDPGFVMRAAQVVTYFPGASPERVEELVSSQIEEAVKEIPELDFVKSESRTGVSIVTVNIKESYKDMRPIWDNLRRKVESTSTDLPDGVVGPYVNDEFGDVFGIVMTITAEGFNYAELKKISDDVKTELLRFPDVAKVEIWGEQEERIFVEYNNSRLSELGLSPSQLSQALETRNIIISGGSFNLGRERISLEPSGNFESVEDIEQTIINIPGSNRLMYLKDIATVVRGYVDPPESLLHSSGEFALAVAVAMREGGNNIELGEQVSAMMNELLQQYPYGIEFDLVSFSPAEVDQKVSDFVSNLLQAIAVVSIVMLFTLGLRTGLVVSTLIPLSMLLAFLVMSYLDIGLDQISLAALIIALGMLVDNGIVMAENIMVLMEKGKSATDAAIDSAMELRIPLLTASLTTIAAFLPIYLAESNVGEFTSSLFKVVAITLLASWVISLTVVPMLCVYFLKVTQQEESYGSMFYRTYRSVLTTLLKNRAVTLVVTLLVFVVAMKGFGYVPKIFFPPSDRNYFQVELKLPEGTAIEETRRVVNDMEGFIESDLKVTESRKEGVTKWASYIGNAGPRIILSYNPKPNNSSYAMMIVTASDAKLVPDLIERIGRYALDNHPDLEATIKPMANGPSVANPVEVRLSGSDADVLFRRVDALKAKMREIGGLTNITDDWGQRIKKLVIHIDQPRALRAGVTSQDIAVSLQAGISGLELTEYREGEDIIPVMVRAEGSNRNNISGVRSLSVYVQSTGKSVPLSQVADIEVVWDTAKIFRRNGLKTVAVGAQLEGDITAAEKFAELTPWLKEQQKEWGTSTRYELGGESESSGKANQSIVDKLPIAGFVILILMVGQFNSIRKAIIILSTIPLGLIGVSAGLLALNSAMGFMTFLGVVSLAGIVINNAIVLLERINLELAEGVEHAQAIINAAQQRTRPILLTTATTVLGLLPLYLGGGEMWEPLAIAIMAGLLFSTILTLCVVPVLYATFYRVRF
ncbi:efflux RND transporter permease subunit [Hahella sp. KA22]|uniref:efflux RND transporter permease subunit n=1 Tax=Hahella sp. KA22 TaxID=1628392 RepID=UPI000FDE6E0C|nr:efflux RND transporter permease subunit [Hahella sp. KA22]AZZ90671.1 efflux RND transporter permease subunit [Hahella sp. KA22]QAY54041.1 efflux RND transporter permease subunit [Hahella sp. KA22]